MVSRYVEWGYKNSGLCFILLLTYFLIVVLPHEQVAVFISRLFRPLGRDNYNLGIAVISILGLSVFLFQIYKGFRIESNKLILIYLLINIILAVICFKVLFVVNIEAVHFIQYLVFTILCFPLVQNYNLTFFYAAIAGTVDEAYQYYYLAPDNKYFDFNDVIIDMVGAVFGLLLIRSISPKIKYYNFRTFARSKHLVFILLLIGIFLILYLIGYFTIYYDPEDLRAKFWLVTEPATGFWTKIPKSFSFHIVRPLEGVLIIGSLFLFYSQIYRESQLVDQ